MKTLRDTNNNNSNTTTQQKLITSNESIYHNSDSSLLTQNRYQQQNQMLSPSNPLTSMFNNDTINPLVYFQLMNNNSMLMQHDLIKQQNVLQPDSNIFVPKTRPMTQNEIAEHARLVYQRALQRNQLQQHNDLMKHFYETLNIKQQESSNTINHNQVPTVPNVSNIGTFDVVDTMIKSPSSCISIKEGSINGIQSSSSLVSIDDSKMNCSILDPGAPIFIPRQSRQKFDDENETSSSSSDSDFNDFNYLDQFLDEFYNTNNENDNHLIIQKPLSSNPIEKYSINHNILGQGDTIDHINEQSVEINNQCQYSIYELLNRYRNPRCHLVLPEWSRLSLILPNICSMRGHIYKIKRYFAYRRRLIESQDN